jgi:hypothetical protein
MLALSPQRAPNRARARARYRARRPSSLSLSSSSPSSVLRMLRTKHPLTTRARRDALLTSRQAVPACYFRDEIPKQPSSPFGAKSPRFGRRLTSAVSIHPFSILANSLDLQSRTTTTRRRRRTRTSTSTSPWVRRDALLTSRQAVPACYLRDEISEHAFLTASAHGLRRVGRSASPHQEKLTISKTPN